MFSRKLLSKTSIQCLYYHTKTTSFECHFGINGTNIYIEDHFSLTFNIFI